MELMGIYEISQLAGVSPQAVSNWVARFPDFPKPLQTLASGPVWDGKKMRAWLSRTRLRGSKAQGRQDVSDFVVGQTYSLNQVQATFGGDRMSYLAERGGRIVCGRFTRAMNTLAPHEIWVGDPPRVQRKAEKLAAQGGTIPVFLKQGPNQWLYHGRMECVGYNTDAKLAAERTREAGRPVVGVLIFRDAIEASMSPTDKKGES